MLILEAASAATIIFLLGYIAGRMDRSERRQDTLSARRVAEIAGMGRGEVARLRREGVL